MGGSRKYLTKAREIEQCVSKRKYHTEQEAAIAAKKTALTGRWYRCPGLKGE